MMRLPGADSPVVKLFITRFFRFYTFHQPFTPTVFFFASFPRDDVILAPHFFWHLNFARVALVELQEVYQIRRNYN